MNEFSTGGYDATLTANGTSPLTPDEDTTSGDTTTPELDPHTFDLAAFIADTATYATYTYTVYLAAEQARRSVELADRLNELRPELETLNRDLERSPASTGSLGETDPRRDRHRELTQEIDDLTAQRQALVDQVKASALTFTFSCTGRDMQKELLDKVQEVINEINADGGADTNNPQRMIEQTAVLMAEMTTKITNSRGQTYPREKITVDLVRDLLNRLSIADISRLSQTMALTLTGAQDYDRAVDAGFPR